MKAGARILIVDDDPEIVKMLARRWPATASRSTPPLGRGRPGPRGDHALRRGPRRPGDARARRGRPRGELRRHLPGLPIGILTGYTHSPLIPNADKSGMAVFTKPVIIQELVDFLEAGVE